ncbi:hypothetical protein DFR31_1149 [Alkalispirillum mobile]|uniref:AmmeMemoRadiSam system protein B n=1 Tax=Alkalispirillum mobile TaxID=85925 RepID=A0A498C7X2_9GAMM|nr:AmmeMemoRadiSam system protein B [Alkalispirillum mobile]RLK51227.1 hypothetical protein DFR31_1149 [Alkalispirillum mobile]
MSHVRRPVVAGLFYPGHPEVLRRSLDALLQARPLLGSPPRAMVLPPRSQARAGEAIASACTLLQGCASQLRRVYLVAESPYTGHDDAPHFDGHGHFQTPLGRLAVDQQRVAELVDELGGFTDDKAHDLEHRLEAPLPYLQRTLHRFRLVPALLPVGAARAATRLLQGALNDDEGLLIVVDQPESTLARRLEAEAATRRLTCQPVTEAEHGRPLALSFYP